MTATPLVSVVVATNRDGAFLHEALASLAAQTYPHIEAIVVDDGSPAPDAILAATSAVPGARVIRQASAGPAAARNTGVATAAGDLLAFLDDDDVWHPERIARHVAAMSDDGVVASYCRMRSVDATGREIAAGDQVPVRGASDVRRRTTGIMLPNLVVRADAFARLGGFDPGLRLAEDLDLVLRLADLGTFAFVPEVLVDYRTHTTNATGDHRRLCEAIDQVLRARIRDARRRGDQDARRDLVTGRRANARYAWWRAARAARRGGPRRAVAELGWAVRFAPTGPALWLARRVPRPGAAS